MPNVGDYDLHKEPTTPPPAPRPPSLIPWIVATLVIVLGVGALYFMRRGDQGPAAPAGTTSTEATVPPARPLGVETPPIDLPALDQSDALVRDLVRALSSHPKIAAWLTTNGLIRNFTVVVENVAAGRTPSRHLRVLRPAEPFRASDARGGATVMDIRSYDRYNDIAAAAASVDAEGAARLYSTLKPRIEEAYRDLGGDNFDRVLESALVQLLQVPVVEGDIAIVPRGGVYNYNDSRLERLTQAQKQLVRMGPRNVRVIQRKLRDVALALGITADRLPAR